MIEIEKQIIKIILKNKKDKTIKLTKLSDLSKDVNLDSLGIMQVIMELESIFGILFEPDDLDLIKTIGELSKLIVKKQIVKRQQKN